MDFPLTIGTYVLAGTLVYPPGLCVGFVAFCRVSWIPEVGIATSRRLHSLAIRALVDTLGHGPIYLISGRLGTAV